MGKTRKKYSRNYYKSAKLPPCDFLDSDTDLVPKEVIKRINSTKLDLEVSSFFTETLRTLKSVQEANPHLVVINKIVCFGLGHFAWCPASRNQLALITLIREHLKVQEILFQDPIFTPKEVEILKLLGFSVIPGNLEGKFDTEDKKYLFYLPHCPKQLTNNLLWTNWGSRLSNILLLCNSFSGVLTSGPATSLRIDAGLIIKAEKFTEEIPLKNTFTFTDVFNDTSIHIFPQKKLEEITETSWNDRGPEPEYTDPELITSASQNNNGISREDTEIPA
uniref:Putative srr1-like protein isoform x1 n=1 Tax=Nyssomyia neivai TaxID=330878 RepID=A0A1L8DAE6_9DIPT